MNNQPLTKYLASHGPWSRRQAEALIRAQRVTIDQKIAQLGQVVNSQQLIQVDGQVIDPQNQEMVYIMLNKPVNYTCTSRSFKDEQNIFQLINNPNRLFVVGRLDKDSQGLVLLTNDGQLANQLTHPRFAQPKTYQVTIKSKLTRPLLLKLQQDLSGGYQLYKDQSLATAEITKQLTSSQVEVVLRQGQKRQIRLLFQKAGYQVTNLKRIAIGSLKLGNLPTGFSRSLTKFEVDSLKKLVDN